MSRYFLLRFESRDDADHVLARSNYASFGNKDEVAQDIAVEIPGTLNSQGVNCSEAFNFTASQVKGLTLPFTIKRSIPYDLLGLSGNANVDFIVDNLTTYQVERENRIGFTVRPEKAGVPITLDQKFEAVDDGGKQIVPAAGYEIWDNRGQGYRFINVADPVDVVPGYFLVLRITGQDQLEADNRASPANNTLWEISKLANDFQTKGSAEAYTPAATDWDWTYTLTYYRRTLFGRQVDMVNPYTLPHKLLRDRNLQRCVM